MINKDNYLYLNYDLNYNKTNIYKFLNDDDIIKCCICYNEQFLNCISCYKCSAVYCNSCIKKLNNNNCCICKKNIYYVTDVNINNIHEVKL